MDGAERAGAGGVDDAVGPAEVEAIGDPAGGDVAEEAGEGVFLPGDVGLADPADDIVGDLGPDAGILQGAAPMGMAEAGAEGDDLLQGAGDAEDHADTVA